MSYSRPTGQWLWAAALAVGMLTAPPALAGEAAPSDPPVATEPARPAQSAAGGDPGAILGPDWTLIGILRRGRMLMVPILLCSVVALAFVVERLVSLRRTVHVPAELTGRVLERAVTEGPDAALRLARERPTALGRLLAAALMRAGTSRREMTQAVLDESGRLQYDLRRNTRVLGVVASVSPLLGLLGTVVGMIRAFDRVAVVGLGRPTELASGIAEALLTTGAGLTVAIPSYLLFHVFKGRGDDIVREVEDRAEQFVIKYHKQLEEVRSPQEEVRSPESSVQSRGEEEVQSSESRVHSTD